MVTTNNIHDNIDTQVENWVKYDYILIPIKSVV